VVRIQDILQKQQVLLDVRAENKAELLGLLVRFLASSCGLAGADVVLQRMLERETQVSTGIGLGIAIPHCRIDGLERACLVAARTAQPTEYDAIDDEPVRLLFMMVSPSNTVTEHAELLSRLSRVLNETRTRERLLAAHTAEEFLQVVVQAEDVLT
jgi:mannitol/fructose-specific phosphotransferase system IIA component (Ntr-type)